MPTCNEIVELFERFAPENLAEDFDNVGLLVGRKKSEVKKVLLTLDVDEDVANEATRNGCDMIISHHPVIFHPIKRINDTTSAGRMMLTLIENNISVYSTHTNMDAAWGGLNDLLLEKLGFSSEEILETGKDEVGIGRVVYIKEGILIRELAEKVKKAFSLSEIRYSGSGERTVYSVGICSGGGSGMIDDCIARGCDAFITGDIKYTGARALWEEGVSVVDLGHYESEHICMELFEKILKKEYGEAITLIHSKENKNIFTAL